MARPLLWPFTGAAIVALDKILNQKDPLHVEEVEFPEDAEQNAEEAAKTAEAYAEVGGIDFASFNLFHS